MTIEESLAALPVAEVCRRCQDETARYRRREAHDDRFCFEVIRRAVVVRDERCWEELYAIYHDQVLAWCRRAGADSSADPDELVLLTWGKFWRSYTAEKLATSSGTTGVLMYLKLCAHSVVTDQARSQTNTTSYDAAPVERPDPDPTPEEAVTELASRAALWELIGRQLRNERERVLMHLLYQIGLKSAEVQSARPDLFPNVKLVYGMTRNVLDRLSRNKELREWLQG